MKKIIFVLIMILGLGAVSYADISNKSLTEDSTTTLSGDVVKPSQNVTIIFSSTASKYAAGSWHSQGSKMYGTTHEEHIQEQTCSADPCGENAIPSVTAGKCPFKK